MVSSRWWKNSSVVVVADLPIPAIVAAAIVEDIVLVVSVAAFVREKEKERERERKKQREF